MGCFIDDFYYLDTGIGSYLSEVGADDFSVIKDYSEDYD